MAETVLLRIDLDAEGVQKNLTSLEEQVRKLSRERKELRDQLDGLIDEEKELNDERKDLDKITQKLTRSDIESGEAKRTLSEVLDRLLLQGKKNTIQFKSLSSAIGAIGDSGNVEAGLEELRTGLELLSGAVDDVRKGTEDSLGIEQISEALAINNATTKEARREYNILSRELRAVPGTLEAQRTQLVRLKNEYIKFASSADRSEVELKQFQTRIRTLNNDIKQQEQALGDNRRNVGNYRESFVQALNAVTPVAKGLTGAIISGIPIADIAIQTIGQGVAAVTELAQEIQEARKQIAIVTGATGNELDVLTAKAQTLSQAFGVDFNRAIEQANGLAQRFRISYEEAFDLIGSGLEGLGEEGTGEFLDIVREYPVIFEQAGVSASEFVAIANQQIRDGFFSDKGVDAIKEGVLSIRELTPATREALEGVGVNTEQLQQRIESGQISLFEGIVEISEKLRDIPQDSQAFGKVMADVFRGAGEDSGDFILNLSQISTNLEEVIENQNDAVKAQRELREANEQLNLAFNRLLGSAGGLFTQIQTEATSLAANLINRLLQAVQFIGNAFINARNGSLIFRRAVQGLVGIFRSAIDVGQSFFRVIDAGFSLVNGRVSEAREKIGEIGKDFAENFDFSDGQIETIDFFSSNFQEDIAKEGKKTGSNFVKSTLDEIKKREDEARKAVVEALKVEALEIEIDLVANSETGSEQELAQRRRLIEIERQIALEAESLTASQRLGIRKRYLEQIQDLEKENNQQSLQARKALIDAQIVEEEKGSQRRFELQRRVLKIERDLALESDKLLNEERLRIQAEYLDKVQQLNLEQSQKQFQELGTIQTQNIELLAQKGLISETERLQRLDELERARIAQRLELFQGSELERQILLQQIELEGLERTEAINQAKIKEQEDLVNAEAELNLARANSVEEFGQIIINLTDEESEARKVGIAIQKAGALAEIAVNLQRQISLIDVAIAAQAALGPLGLITGAAFTARKVLAIASAAAQTAAVLGVKLQDGGEIAEAIYNQTGYNVLQLAEGGKLMGPSHARGGIPGYVQGFGMVELEGNEFVTKKAATANNLGILERINREGHRMSFDLIPRYAMGGQVPKLETGGLTNFTPTSSFASGPDIAPITLSRNNDDLVNMIQSMPPNVVILKELREALAGYEQSTFFSD